MNNHCENHEDAIDRLIDQAASAIRQTAAPPMPPALPAAAVARMQAAARQPRIVKLYERIMAMKARNKLVAAASFLIAVGAVITLIAVMTARPSIAYADVKEQLQKAKTIQMTVSVAMPVQGTSMPVDVRMKMRIKDPGLMRIENTDAGAVTIIDNSAKKMLVLEPDKKEAMLLDVGKLPLGGDKQQENWLENVRKYLDGTERPLGERKIDGKLATGFCVKKDTGEMEIWVDNASGHLAMIKITSSLPGTPFPSIILRDIVLNPEMPDSLFSLTPPEGYTLKRQTMNLANPVEDDLVAGLRMLVTKKGDPFPDSLSPVELVSRMEAAIKVKSESEKQAVTQAFTRMIVFVAVQGRTNRFQYAGKGVKLGDADTPVAWWKKGDGSSYRVLMGDLSLKDLSADKLPAATATTSSAPCSLPSAGAGLVRVQIIDSAGSNMSVGLLKPEVVVRVEKTTTTGPADTDTWTKGISEFSGPTTKKAADLVVRIDDPRGQRANLPVVGPLKIFVYDSEAGTLASLEGISAGVTLTIKPKAGEEKQASPELRVEMRDAEGKTKDVTRGK